MFECLETARGPRTAFLWRWGAGLGSGLPWRVAHTFPSLLACGISRPARQPRVRLRGEKREDLKAKHRIVSSSS